MNRILFLLTSFYLACALLFCSCATNNKKTPKQPKEIQVTPTEKKKTEMLKQIDRKFETPAAHYELGKIYQQQGLWTEAEQQYTITLGFDPIHRQAQAARVSVLNQMGDKATADFSADFYINQASASALASLKLALAFKNERLDDFAVRCYEQALRLAPNSARINKEIGYYYLAKGEQTRATDYLRRSFDLNPNQPEIAGELGRLGIQIQRRPSRNQNTKQLESLKE